MKAIIMITFYYLLFKHHDSSYLVQLCLDLLNCVSSFVTWYHACSTQDETSHVRTLVKKSIKRILKSCKFCYRLVVWYNGIFENSRFLFSVRWHMKEKHVAYKVLQCSLVLKTNVSQLFILHYYCYYLVNGRETLKAN